MLYKYDRKAKKEYFIDALRCRYLNIYTVLSSKAPHMPKSLIWICSLFNTCVLIALFLVILSSGDMYICIYAFYTAYHIQNNQFNCNAFIWHTFKCNECVTIEKICIFSKYALKEIALNFIVYVGIMLSHKLYYEGFCIDAANNISRIPKC